MSEWGCCAAESGEAEQFIDCTSCSKCFHFACLSIAPITDTGISQTWKCPGCINAAPKPQKKDSTPIRNVNTGRGNKRPALNSPPGSSAVTGDDVREIVQEVVRSEISNLFEKFSVKLTGIVNKELEPLRKEMNDINESITYMSKRFDDIEEEQAAAKASREELQKENAALKISMSEIKARVNGTELRINSVEQQLRSNNIEVQCVPENKNENLNSIVMQISSIISCKLDESAIIRCTRTAKVSPDSSRPRSIVVQLSSPRIRDEYLASVAKYNKTNPSDKLNSSHIGYGGTKSPIYVVEHLSPSNKALHAAARLKAKEKGYKYVWIRAGRIYVRKSDDSKFILIKNIDTVNHIL